MQIKYLFQEVFFGYFFQEVFFGYFLQEVFFGYFLQEVFFGYFLQEAFFGYFLQEVFFGYFLQEVFFGYFLFQKKVTASSHPTHKISGGYAADLLCVYFTIQVLADTKSDICLSMQAATSPPSLMHLDHSTVAPIAPSRFQTGFQSKTVLTFEQSSFKKFAS